MPEKLQGMGAIPGVAIGKIMKAGQALDGHLAAYKPGTVEEELEKLNAAVAEVADVLEKSVEQMSSRRKTIRRPTAKKLHARLMPK